MWVFNPEKVEEFLDWIAAGFNTEPLDVVLFFAMAALVIGGPLLLSALSAGRRRARHRAEAVGRFDAALAALRLEPDEAEAAAALARAFSRDPDRWTSVLSRTAAFNAAAAQAGVDPALLARLRLKLRLAERRPQGHLHSTVELEAGAPVSVSGASTAPVGGSVARVDAAGFEVRVAGPVSGSRVLLRIPRSSGVYEVEAQVIEASRGALRLAHAEVRTHIQKRRFLRRRVRGRATVLLADGSSVAVRLVDLGGGGARLEAPPQGLKAGDEVTLSLGRPDGWNASFASRVVRTYAEGFSLAFVGPPDARRDELIRRLR